MTLVQKMKKMGKTDVIAAAVDAIQAEAVEEAVAKLKDLYRQEKKAKKVWKNIQREIEDYLMELEIDEEDNGDDT